MVPQAKTFNMILPQDPIRPLMLLVNEFAPNVRFRLIIIKVKRCRWLRRNLAMSENSIVNDEKSWDCGAAATLLQAKNP